MRLTTQQRLLKKQKKTARAERTSGRSAREAELADMRAKQVLTIPEASNVSRYPIDECRVMTGIWAKGIGHVVVSRNLPDGRVLMAVFLVDTFCLGVKDAFKRRVDDSEYQYYLSKIDSHRVAPEYACKLVLDAVHYAASLNLAPHPDYLEAREVLAGIDATRCEENFEFGHDGQPHYIVGPNDTRAKVTRILKALQVAVGADGFKYTGPFEWTDRQVAPNGLRLITRDEYDDYYENVEEGVLHGHAVPRQSYG